MEKHLDLLGWNVEDKVTKFSGVVTHVGVDLFGCVSAIVQPPIFQKDGETKKQESLWFDVSRLVKLGDQPVMEPVPVKGDKLVAGADCYKPCK